MGKNGGINRFDGFTKVFTSHSKTPYNWSLGPCFYTWPGPNLLLLRSICCSFWFVSPLGDHGYNIPDLDDSEIVGKVCRFMNNHIHHDNLVIDGWPFRIQKPSQPDETRVILLLHGHLGNENVMWTLTKPLSDNYYMLAPRAPIKLGINQYSWHEIQPQWPGISYYRQISDQLLKRIDIWRQEERIKANQVDVMGFSQGAVLAYSLALLYPERIRKVAGLSGFIPQSWQKSLTLGSLKEKKIFITHGTRDDIVPITSAYQTASWLRNLDADVTFCESNTGHKIGIDCVNELELFFRFPN